jgi:hypothetical protein
VLPKGSTKKSDTGRDLCGETERGLRQGNALPKPFAFAEATLQAGKALEPESNLKVLFQLTFSAVPYTGIR